MTAAPSEPDAPSAEAPKPGAGPAAAKDPIRDGKEAPQAASPAAKGAPAAPASAKPDVAKSATPAADATKGGPAAASASTTASPKPDATKSDLTKTEPPRPGTADTVKPGTSSPAAAKPATATSAIAGPGPKGPDPLNKPGEPAATVRPAVGATPQPAKTETGKTETGKTETGKPAGTVSDATSKPDASKPETGTVDPAKAGTADPTKAGPSKPEPSRSGFAGGTSGKPGEAVTDGPIIDLRAKRIPDPAAPGTATAAKAEPIKSDPAKPQTGPAGAAAGKAEPGRTTPSGIPVSGQSSGKAAQDAPAAEPARGGVGVGPLVAASLLGGLIGAGALFAVEQFHGPAGDPRIAAVERQLAALDQRVAGNEAVLKPLPEAVRGAEAAAKQALAKPAPGPAAAGGETQGAPAIPADLASRLDSLDQRVAALQEEPGRDQAAGSALSTNQAGDGQRRLEALDERLKALETAKGSEGTKGGELAGKVAALEAGLQARAKADQEADTTLGARIDGLQQSLDARVKAATQAVETATAAARQTADASKAEAQESARSIERQLGEQRERLASLDKALAGRAETATVQAALRVVAADRIALALRTGAPYAETIAALRGLGGADAAKLDALSPFAGTGAPGAGTLASEFRQIVERAAAKRKSAQARSVAESGDVRQRLFSMAESIVQVRKVDGPAAAEPGAAGDSVARVQAALDRGALSEAASGFDALPQDLRTEAEDFGARLKARAAAEAAAAALSADAFRTLAGPIPPAGGR